MYESEISLGIHALFKYIIYSIKFTKHKLMNWAWIWAWIYSISMNVTFSLDFEYFKMIIKAESRVVKL